MYRRRHEDENENNNTSSSSSAALPSSSFFQQQVVEDETAVVVVVVDDDGGNNNNNNGGGVGGGAGAGRDSSSTSRAFLKKIFFVLPLFLLCCRRRRRHWWWNTFNSLSVPKRIVLVLLVVWNGYFVVQKLIYWFPRGIEEPFKDYPYWRALIFNPVRYIQAKSSSYYFTSSQSPPRRMIRNFTMTPERAYYINMDRSKDRMKMFIEMNKDDDDDGNDGGEINIQRFSAHEWVVDTADDDGGSSNNTTKASSRDHAARLSLQQEWEDRYPFLRLSSRRKKYGDAGCSLSHLLLWQEKLIDNHDRNDDNYNNRNDDDDQIDDQHRNPYLFVFEDDALLLEPLRRRRRVRHNNRQKNNDNNNNNDNNYYPVISAPDEADIVFLVGTAMKLVDVPWRRWRRPRRWRGGEGNISSSSEQQQQEEEQTEQPAVRVIGGYGALGYIITRNGAIKMMEYLRTSKEPVDLSFFEAPSSLKVFLPIVSSQWPAVRHRPVGGSSRSARINLNQRRR